MRHLRTINGVGIYQNNKREVAEYGFDFTILSPSNMECIKDSVNFFTPFSTEWECCSLDFAVSLAEHYNNTTMVRKACSIADLELKYSWFVDALSENLVSWHSLFCSSQRYFLNKFPNDMTAAEICLSIKEIAILFSFYLYLRDEGLFCENSKLSEHGLFSVYAESKEIGEE